MKDIPIEEVRNFALLGHSHCGKTTLLDAMLHQLKLTGEQGSVDSGTSAGDWTPEEKEHKFTIWPKPYDATFTTHDGHKSALVIIDTPGYDEFFGSVVAATRACDAALIVIDAASGIQVGTTRAWRRCEDRSLPRGIAITGLDKDNTDFYATVARIQAVWGSRCIPVVLPTTDGKAVFDMLEPEDPPEDLAARVTEYKTAILEAVAESDDSLIEKYLGGEKLTREEYSKGLHVAVNEGHLIPIFAVYARQGVGIEDLLEAIHHSFPSPHYHDVVDREGHIIPIGKDQPFTGVVWRMVNDPFAGQLDFVRVWSGTLRADADLFNATQNQKERAGNLLIVNGNKQTPVKEAHAGDIVAIPKLKHTRTNDTLCQAGTNVQFEPIHFPNPVMSAAIVVKKKGEEEKLGEAMHRAANEDPTIHFERNPETRQLVLSGMGDIHLGVTIEHMKQRSNIDVELRPPKVAYKETVTRLAEGHHRHKKQSGGRGQYGEVYLRVEPRDPSEEDWFVNKIVGGAIPSNYIPAVEKGLVEGMEKGGLAGFPVVNIRATVYDGTFHNVDSSEMAFKVAASRALNEGMSKANPALLEPIMNVSVTVPEQFLGDINRDLNQRRGRVLGIGEDHGLQVVNAEVPKAEILRYASDLRAITGGQGSFEMEFSRYDMVPGQIAQKVIEQVKAEKEG